MRNLLLIFMIAFTMNVSAQHNSLYYVFIDVTDSALVDTFKKQVKKAGPQMIAQAGVKKGNGIEIKFFSISNLKQGVRASLKVTPREISFFESKYDRPDEIEEATNKLPGILKKFVKDAYPHTRIVDAVSAEMNKFKASRAKYKTIIVFSDLFENYTTSSQETLDWENIYFVRGIAKPGDQNYVKAGDAHENKWKQRIPNVIISTELELY